MAASKRPLPNRRRATKRSSFPQHKRHPFGIIPRRSFPFNRPKGAPVMSRPITRRRFLSGSAAVGAAAVLSNTSLRALGANEDVRIAIVGTGGRGSDHIKAFSKVAGCRIVAVCDADESHLGKAVQNAEKAQKGQKVKGFGDYRKLLEDKEIDAIATATPNHWHSLVTV